MTLDEDIENCQGEKATFRIYETSHKMRKEKLCPFARQYKPYVLCKYEGGIAGLLQMEGTTYCVMECQYGVLE